MLFADFSDLGAMWREDFETDNFIQSIDKLWKMVEPLYLELHTYVKRKLSQRYGKKIDVSDGLIPANILGK